MFLKILLLFSLRFVAATNYCDLCEQNRHTLCKYPNEGPGQFCVDYKKHNLTDLLKAYIVNIHNDIRNHVASGQERRGKLGNQPSAADMLRLEWDDELATIAQRWADQCLPPELLLQHDECKKTERFEMVGQNILTAVTSDNELPDLTFLILNWYNQVDHVVTADIEHFAGIKRAKYSIGHYTQLVWAKTRYVGCGLAVYGGNKTGASRNKRIYYNRLVCNYAPAGNVIEEHVYQIGNPCSRCPQGICNDLRTNLCQGTNNFTKFKRNYIHIEKNQTFPQLKVVNFMKNTSNTQDQLIGELKQSSSMAQDTILDVLVLGDNYFPRKQRTSKRKHVIYIKEDEVLLPTNLTYKKVVGIWHNGYCRCNIIPRSSSKTNILPSFMLFFNLILYNLQ